MRRRTPVLKVAVALSLCAALLVPVSALAVAHAGHGAGKGAATAAQASAAAPARLQAHQTRLAVLRQRIVAVLERRKARFDLATVRISSRSQVLSSLADRVEKAGGDVSAVRTSIDKVTSLLTEADQQEALAVAKFQEVPDATNRRLAFAQARAQGRAAVATLSLARVTLRNAVLDLRGIVTGLKAASK